MTAEVGSGPPLRTCYRPDEPVDVRRTLTPLRRGGGDPTHREEPGGVWRTARTPDGAATLHVEQRPGGEVLATAWGEGAGWVLAGLPDLLGGRDRPGEFEPRSVLLREMVRRTPGLRVCRTGLVLDALVPAVLEQKVTGREARSAWRELVLRHGEPAPGPAPAGMRVAPAARTWSLVPSWDWHRAGVDGKRSRTVVAAAGLASRLEQCCGMAAADAERRLRAVPGVGVWTAAEVAQRAFGDADALSVGDFHLAAFVGWALLGRPLDDDGMLAHLAEHRPHRYRVVRLLECSGVRMPRFGPRLTIQDHRAI